VLGDVLARDAWSSVPQVRPGHGDPSGGDPGGGDAPTALALHATSPLRADDVQQWLDAAVAEHGPRLLRLHAVLQVIDGDAERPETVRCWGVRTFATSEVMSGGDLRMPAAGSRVVLVGEGLDHRELTETFPGSAG
jgi:hypothetical protein